MLIPYRVDVPMSRVPWANWVLMGATIVVSIFLFSPIEEWSRSLEIPAIFASLGVPLVPPAAPGVLRYFILQPDYFHPAQLVGNLFAHAGWLHLIGNMLFLWVFGNAVNAKIGQWQYLTLYFGAGILESTIWLAIGPHMPALGASGAIMAIVGAFLLLYPLNDVSCVLFWGWVVRTDFQFSSGWLIALYAAYDVWGAIFQNHEGVGYLSHVAGFLTGAGVLTALLWWHIVEPARGERTLLQAFHLMMEEEEEISERPKYLPLHGLANSSAGGGRGVSTQARAQAKPRETRPIPLD